MGFAGVLILTDATNPRMCRGLAFLRVHACMLFSRRPLRSL